MPDLEFPTYAINYSRKAKDTRASLPLQLRATIDAIESELSDDPNKHPDRIIAASRNGASLVYKHPDPAVEITFEIDDVNKVLYLFHYSAPAFTVPKSIFISYSHKDDHWLNRLRAFLTVLEQQGIINFWDDSRLKPGEPWRDQIKEALESAKAGLLLVSQNFLTSKFVTDTELPELLDGAVKKGIKIFWIHIQPSTVFETNKEITQFQSLHDNPSLSVSELEGPQQERAFVEISKRLREAVGEN